MADLKLQAKLIGAKLTEDIYRYGLQLTECGSSVPACPPSFSRKSLRRMKPKLCSRERLLCLYLCFAHARSLHAWRHQHVHASTAEGTGARVVGAAF